MSITLLQLRTQARQRADMENSQFIKDPELNSYINSSIAELHDLLVQSYGSDYYVKSSTFSTTNNQDTYQLSSIITDNDFYKLKGLDAKLSGNYSFLGVTSLRYRLVGSGLVLTPIPDENTEIRIWYTPVATQLANDTDILEDLNQYAEYVIVDAAIKMMQKEESDVSVLAAQKAALKRRIEEAANNRDAAIGESITDVYAGNEEFFYGRTTSGS